MRLPSLTCTALILGWAGSAQGAAARCRRRSPPPARPRAALLEIMSTKCSAGSPRLLTVLVYISPTRGSTPELPPLDPAALQLDPERAAQLVGGDDLEGAAVSRFPQPLPVLRSRWRKCPGLRSRHRRSRSSFGWLAFREQCSPRSSTGAKGG